MTEGSKRQKALIVIRYPKIVPPPLYPLLHPPQYLCYGGRAPREGKCWGLLCLTINN